MGLAHYAEKVGDIQQPHKTAAVRPPTTHHENYPS